MHDETVKGLGFGDCFFATLLATPSPQVISIPMHVCVSDVPHPIGLTDKRVETVVDGLTPYSSYVFRVRAINILGEGPPSAPSRE